jgi:hypothetical protein
MLTLFLAVVPLGDLHVVADFFPPSALGRIRPGQPTRLRCAGFPWAQYGSLAVTVRRVASEVRDGHVRVELSVDPEGASPIPLQHGLPGAVEVQVERVAPAALVLRAAGKLLARPVAGAQVGVENGRVSATPPARRRLLAPEVVQTSAMDCGPAALKCLLEGFGIAVSYGLLREACQTDVDGTSIDTLEEVAVQLGLEVKQVMLLDHVLLPEAQALPALVVVQLPSGVTHFVVAWCRHGHVVHLMGPGHQTAVTRLPALPPRALYAHNAVPSAPLARVGGLGGVPRRPPPAHGTGGALRRRGDRSGRRRPAGSGLAPAGGPGCFHADGHRRGARRRPAARSAGGARVRALFRTRQGGASGRGGDDHGRLLDGTAGPGRII